ncbi:unnamed protein product [Didymodactylos carnosus]|uniref:Uncharacterized protein n=1 Tax=Didymodactylos carnosus TaxID=1234261 RepID=A0A814Q0S1_9BILA|nr:unnamed protein product [Didymodactylos carnosus]CAF3877388.1 unnamed protein product [Didymodactylos carnosus]
MLNGNVPFHFGLLIQNQNQTGFCDVLPKYRSIYMNFAIMKIIKVYLMPMIIIGVGNTLIVIQLTHKIRLEPNPPRNSRSSLIGQYGRSKSLRSKSSYQNLKAGVNDDNHNNENHIIKLKRGSLLASHEYDLSKRKKSITKVLWPVKISLKETSKHSISTRLSCQEFSLALKPELGNVFSKVSTCNVIGRKIRLQA